MKKIFYTDLFHKAEEGGFWVSFPDIPECLTQGDDMEQAYEMAADALGLALVCREQEHEPLPAASDPTSISPETDSFLVVMEFDMLAYKKRTSSRAVKKTLSIPDWLNEAAMAMDLNFSQIPCLFFQRTPRLLHRRGVLLYKTTAQTSADVSDASASPASYCPVSRLQTAADSHTLRVCRLAPGTFLLLSSRQVHRQLLLVR